MNMKYGNIKWSLSRLGEIEKNTALLCLCPVISEFRYYLENKNISEYEHLIDVTLNRQLETSYYIVDGIKVFNDPYYTVIRHIDFAIYDSKRIALNRLNLIEEFNKNVFHSPSIATIIETLRNFLVLDKFEDYLMYEIANANIFCVSYSSFKYKELEILLYKDSPWNTVLLNVSFRHLLSLRRRHVLI